MKYFSIILISFVILSCKTESKTKILSANYIVNESIEISGGDKFGNSDISFEFRDIDYRVVRINGKFSLIRMFNNDEGFIIDTKSNEGFTRAINFEVVKLEDSMAMKYAASVNSVHYFSTLPYGLNDKAVNKILLDEEKIKDRDHYKIKVTFNQDGGGEDFEDVFVYWIDKTDFKINYLAYSYNEEDGIGMRFREAYNERYINGLRFADYNNYKANDSTIILLDLGKAFDNNQLKLLSKIELENVKVDLIDL